MKAASAGLYRLASTISVGVALTAWLVLSSLGVVDANRVPPFQEL